MLPLTLVTTMTAGSFQILAFAVLASRIIPDLGVSRTQLGLLGSINTGVGALVAPSLGRLTDKIGPRQSVVAALGISGVGLVLTALSTNLWLLALSAFVSGFPQGWCNPATNALIAARVAEGSRGALTGIKQSGVQFGVFLSGVTLPGLSTWLSWRGAMWVYAGGCFALAIAVPLFLAADDPSVTRAGQPAGRAAKKKAPLDPFIIRLAVYALLMGTAGGAVGRFFPLWAEEVIGFSNATAGVIVALGGLFGIVARIAVGRFAERSTSPSRLLGLLALVGASYYIVLLATGTVGSWVLWVSPVLMAIGVAAWNAVAMLTVIMTVPRADAGRASGVVMLGFLGGLGIGSPLAGLAVDLTDSYQPMFAGALALALLSAALTLPNRPARK